MANEEAHNIVSCEECHKPVEHHCNFCIVSLCLSCMTKHMANKTKRHEIVEFIHRKEGLILPECTSHKGKQCEIYCKSCRKPSCALCVTTEHTKHDFIGIEEVLENMKKQIIVDTQELDNTIIPKYRNTHGELPAMAFDDVISAIQDQEDNICKVVRDIGSQLKDKILTQEQEYEKKKEEIKSLSTEVEAKLKKCIKNNESILQSNNAASILSYMSRNDDYRCGPERMKLSFPNYIPGKINQDYLHEIFGDFRTELNITSNRKPDILRLEMLTLPIVSIFQTLHGLKQKLWRVVCEGTEKIWTCGENNKMYLLDRAGSTLKTIYVPDTVLSMSPNMKHELTFSVGWKDTNVYTYGSEGVTPLLELSQWYPRGLCYTMDENLLVSMRSVDETQSRVVKYSGTKEVKVIRTDIQGQPLFSVNAYNVLLLTENRNGDICVADFEGESVVVLNASGEKRFTYQKYFSDKAFRPHMIATDVEHHILIQEYINNIVHVIDSDGNFLRYIEFPCNGGMSIDTDQNLAVGDQDTGEIRIIKYLQ